MFLSKIDSWNCQIPLQVEKFQQNGTTQREIHSSAGPTDVIVERHEVRRKYHILENSKYRGLIFLNKTWE